MLNKKYFWWVRIIVIVLVLAAIVAYANCEYNTYVYEVRVDKEYTAQYTAHSLFITDNFILIKNGKKVFRGNFNTNCRGNLIRYHIGALQAIKEAVEYRKAIDAAGVRKIKE